MDGYKFGDSMMFYGGILLAAAFWHWNKDHYIKDPAYSRTKKGVDLERAAFFTMVIATLGSALFEAVAGANTGSGFETFLAEDLIRTPEKDSLMLSVIGHLHLMLTMIAVAAALIIGKCVDFKGVLHKKTPCL